MARGKFITIEGIEGAGKSTAISFIQKYLLDAKKDVVLTREPGGTPLAEEIREVLLYPKSTEPMQAKTELLLMFAGRAQHIGSLIQPALASGKWVVSDRFVDASYAYQGGGRYMDINDIRLLDKFVVGDCYPDLTILMDLPAELGVSRAEKRGTNKDRIEQEKIEFFMRVRQIYLDRAHAASERIKLIDASQTLESVQAQIQVVLNDFMSRH